MLNKILIRILRKKLKCKDKCKYKKMEMKAQGIIKT